MIHRMTMDMCAQSAGNAHQGEARADASAKGTSLIGRIRNRWDAAIREACRYSSVPPEFLGALTANESAGDPRPVRFEPAVYRHLVKVAAGSSTRYGSLTRNLIAAEVAEILSTKTPAYHAGFLSGGFASAHGASLAHSPDEALRELATSWGLTQIMGYHMVGRAGAPRDLFEPGFHFRVALELLELLIVDAHSLQQFGLAGQHTIESKGMSLARGGASLAGLTATRIFRRYAGIKPANGLANGGAAVYTVKSHYLTLAVEVGDYVFLSHPLLPDFETGRRGVIHRICEVVEKQPNFTEGTMTYRLLDMGWMAGKHLSSVALEGTPAYPVASSSQQLKHMFIADQASGHYSDGTAARTIF